MTGSIPGLHHITAISGAAQENLDFYTGVLGLRLVKTTVNFDDPTTYHLYYGNRTGRPGTVLTFFPWPRAVAGRPGAGMATRVSFAVPQMSLDAWTERLETHDVSVERVERPEEEALRFAAPDGLPLELVGVPETYPGADSAWTGGPVPKSQAVRGFFGTTIPALHPGRTLRLFTDLFGWEVTYETDDRVRVQPPASTPAPGQAIDLATTPAPSAGRMGRGTVHHVALRAGDADEQARWQQALRDRGLHVTEVKDRQYFRSIYVRDSEWTSGVLLEVATDGPGFATDEPVEQLGARLQLPDWLEDRRDELVRALPPLDRPAPLRRSS